MSNAYKAKLIYYQGGFHSGLVLETKGSTITRIISEEKSEFQPLDLGSVAILPGTVNTHAHSFQSLVRGFGDDLSFVAWRDNGIYKYSQNLDTEGIYVGALFAFGEMLKHGITTVCDFFYIQNGGNENARAVIRAAKDVGIRLVLARCFYDWQKAPKIYRETPLEARERCLELMDEFKDSPGVTIYPAPHSPHAASSQMIIEAARLAHEKNAMFHIHVAEAKYEVEQIQKEKKTTPLLYLDELGVLNSKMVVIHGVWLTDREISLMAQKKVKLSYNPSSNMFLGDGIAPITKMREQNITIALGTDGACSNNKTSIFEEMRLTALLQKVHALDSTQITAEEAFRMGTQNGGKVLGLDIGELKEGYAADFITVDLNALELQPLQNLHKNMVYAFSSLVLKDVFVLGEKVYSEHQLLKIPEKDICERVRRLTSGW